MDVPHFIDRVKGVYTELYKIMPKVNGNQFLECLYRPEVPENFVILVADPGHTKKLSENKDLFKILLDATAPDIHLLVERPPTFLDEGRAGSTKTDTETILKNYGGLEGAIALAKSIQSDKIQGTCIDSRTFPLIPRPRRDIGPKIMLAGMRGREKKQLLDIDNLLTIVI